MTYSNDWLLAQIDAGWEPDYLYFWGHRPRKDGQLGKSCFSQWWHQGFMHEGIHYPTAEHWMMVHKARTFEDEATVQAILADPDPRQAKAYGRQINGYQNEPWAAVKYPIVVAGNVMKFSQNAELKAFLLATADTVLVEASPFDNQWGIGLDEKSATGLHPRDWQGTNLLGWALMEARDRLGLE